MQIIWTDATVQAAIISALGTVLAAALAAIAAALIGKQIAGRKKLVEQLRLAVSDVAFLLAVEEAHCNIHRNETGAPNKIRVRNQVIANGQTWSGQFTPGRARRNPVIGPAN